MRILHFSFSKLPLLVRATSWPKRGCAAVCRCSRSSSRECEPSWMTPFGADRCLATAWCMWMSVWSSTVSGAPCSLCTAYPWEPMSSQWSECSSTRLHHMWFKVALLYSHTAIPVFQAMLRRRPPLGWLHDHCPPWTAQTLWHPRLQLPPSQGAETRRQGWGHQECGELERCGFSIRSYMMAVYQDPRKLLHPAKILSGT